MFLTSLGLHLSQETSITEKYSLGKKLLKKIIKKLFKKIKQHKNGREKLARDRGDQSDLALTKTQNFGKKPSLPSNLTAYAGRS